MTREDRATTGDVAAVRPTSIRILIAALAVQGLSGMAGGLGLIFDPTGASLAIPIEWLRGSPFDDYLIPGVVLFTALGVAPLVAAHGLLRRRSWAWVASLAIGLALLVWLGVEIAVVGYRSEPPLQLVYGVVGGFILLATLSPSARDHLRQEGIDR